MQEADLVRLKHMLDAATEILEFTKNKNRDDFNNDRMLNLSIVHLLEIVGEAASGISIEVRNNYTQIPWNVIVGMRNRLIHGYFDIDLDIVWKTVTHDIPPLIPELEKIIKFQDQ
jgi:uncharacterized protein with HEPN domain